MEGSATEISWVHCQLKMAVVFALLGPANVVCVLDMLASKEQASFVSVGILPLLGLKSGPDENFWLECHHPRSSKPHCSRPQESHMHQWLPCHSRNTEMWAWTLYE